MFSRGGGRLLLVMLTAALLMTSSHSEGRRWLEYGSNTIVYVLSSDPFEVDNMQLSQSLSQALVANRAETVAAGGGGGGGGGHSSCSDGGGGSAINPTGIAGGEPEDCEANAARMLIRDLRPGMRHVSLIGLVAGVSGNMPVVKKGGSGSGGGSGSSGRGRGNAPQITDRYCIRLRDGTGSVNITFWGAAGAGVASTVNDPLIRECAKLCIGQAVLLEGVRIRPLPAAVAAPSGGGARADASGSNSSSSSMDSSEMLSFAASCSKKSAGSLKCISALPSIICLKQAETLLLSQVHPQTPGNTIVKAVITTCVAAGSALASSPTDGGAAAGGGGGGGGGNAVIDVHSDCNRFVFRPSCLWRSVYLCACVSVCVCVCACVHGLCVCVPVCPVCPACLRACVPVCLHLSSVFCVSVFYLSTAPFSLSLSLSLSRSRSPPLLQRIVC